jgi:hypothetical protein
MMLLMRNLDVCYTACPILDDEQIEAYINRGEAPTGAAYIEVPPTKVIRQRGFWLRPHHRMRHTAALFLISTDVYAMNEDDHAERRDRIYCYRSAHANTAYLGRVETLDCRHKSLSPLIEGLHDPLDIQACSLVYVGRVIAAI